MNKDTGCSVREGWRALWRHWRAEKRRNPARWKALSIAYDDTSAKINGWEDAGRGYGTLAALPMGVLRWRGAQPAPYSGREVFIW